MHLRHSVLIIPSVQSFSSELESLFLLGQEENLRPTELKGSYAGAMGYGQFTIQLSRVCGRF